MYVIALLYFLYIFRYLLPPRLPGRGFELRFRPFSISPISIFSFHIFKSFFHFHRYYNPKITALKT
ncbi:hypothetical protein [Sulfolobus tengchongensis spindle-shaped virus 4]|nr:hypothetical protein [Sulfolobus tengchongensis spindle-shaped virus 4]